MNFQCLFKYVTKVFITNYCHRRTLWDLLSRVRCCVVQCFISFLWLIDIHFRYLVYTLHCICNYPHQRDVSVHWYYQQECHWFCDCFFMRCVVSRINHLRPDVLMIWWNLLAMFLWNLTIICVITELHRSYDTLLFSSLQRLVITRSYLYQDSTERTTQTSPFVWFSLMDFVKLLYPWYSWWFN